jgi:hypothetical protein
MTRSPLAYPLNRSADLDIGGAADLQTDIMRFMAILSLCLVAIFALVQSIPLTPIEPLSVNRLASKKCPSCRHPTRSWRLRLNLTRSSNLHALRNRNLNRRRSNKR